MDFYVEVQLFKGRRSIRLDALKDRSLLREANERSLFRMRSAKIVNVSSHSGNNIFPLGSNANGDQSVVEDYSINIDKQKISQVVRNLLSNALKFTPKGGKITIKATVTLNPRCERHADTLPPVEGAEPCPDCSLSPPYFRFEVTDTGPGISSVSDCV